MTGNSEVDRVIVVVDLRPITDPAPVLKWPFYEWQAKHGLGAAGQQIDFGRVILVDEASQLTAHDEIYAHVLDSHLDVQMLCVAIGPPPADDLTIAIRRPLQLGLQKAAILWVGDLDGIGWQMDSSLASQVNLPDHGGTPDPARLPDDLLEILRVRQVFDEVITLTGHLPGSNVASPGYRTIRSDIPAEILTTAQRSAIKQLVKESGGVTSLQPLEKLEDILSLNGQRPDRPADIIRPGERVDDLIQQSRRTGNSAAALMRQVTGIGGFAGTNPGVRAALRVFARTLDDLRGVVAWAFDEADTHSGFDPRQRQNLSDIGIELTEPPAVAVDQVTATLTERALDSMGKCEPLPAIVDRLRDEAETAAPHGTARYSARLQKIVSSSFLDTLRKPPPFITGWPPAAALLAAFAACLISGAWPEPHGLYGGIAAIGAILIGIWIVWRGAAISPGTGADTGRFLGGHIAASVIGAVCGVGLSTAITAQLPAGVGAVITVVMLVVLAAVSWRAQARRWAQAVQVTKVLTVANSIGKLVVDATREEWQLAGARTIVSNHARRLASMIADATAALRDQEAKLSGTATSPTGTPLSGGYQRRSPNDQVSRELVTVDLATGTASALGRLIVAPGPGGLAAVDAQVVSREINEMLDEYRVHLLTASLHEPPPFGRPPERRAELVQSLVERGSDMQSAVRYTVGDERITQLCSPPQLTFLETGTDKAELIRFAPRSAQGLIDQRATDQGRPVEWTSASAIAGVLRLVALRPGAVVDVIPHAPARPSSTSSPAAAAPPRPAGEN